MAYDLGPARGFVLLLLRALSSWRPQREKRARVESSPVLDAARGYNCGSLRPNRRHHKTKLHRRDRGGSREQVQTEGAPLRCNSGLREVDR